MITGVTLDRGVLTKSNVVSVYLACTMPAVDVNGLSALEVRPYRVLITGFGVSCRSVLLTIIFSNAPDCPINPAIQSL